MYVESVGLYDDSTDLVLPFHKVGGPVRDCLEHATVLQTLPPLVVIRAFCYNKTEVTKGAMTQLNEQTALVSAHTSKIHPDKVNIVESRQ